MRNLNNTLWDALDELELAHILQTRVECNEPNKWIVHILHPDRETAVIRIEILVRNDGDVAISLLQRRGFSRRITESILDALIEHMDTDDEESVISSQSLEQ